ncbi:hypothetical protein [Sphingosinicella sp. BN140058]|uniref:hypothetical protein n=1 Tax=Sphingosinicella sp. BN140058 TaxID=1892855 RepID=UPI001011A960|nr:hypothetical protein [Sphingosinicella sp. BN140058]QAY78316.1 hypothetical protein ETR14_18570 [Sphingosinicella sp. BN140058]
MSDSPGRVLAGVFLIVAGICLTLVGGGCTLILLSMIGEILRGSDGILLFGLAIAVLAAGVWLVIVGSRMLKRNRS